MKTPLLKNKNKFRYLKRLADGFCAKHEPSDALLPSTFVLLKAKNNEIMGHNKVWSELYKILENRTDYFDLSKEQKSHVIKNYLQLGWKVVPIILKEIKSIEEDYENM